MRTKTFLAYVFTSLSLIIALIAFVFYLREIMLRELFCDNFSSAIEMEIDELNVSVGKGKLVKGQLINYGIEDEYKISTKGPDWVVVKPDKLRLEKNQTGEIFTYISPPLGISDDFLISIITRSFCQEKEENILLHIK